MTKRIVGLGKENSEPHSQIGELELNQFRYSVVEKMKIKQIAKISSTNMLSIAGVIIVDAIQPNCMISLHSN
jgi:hypothetical protein